MENKREPIEPIFNKIKFFGWNLRSRNFKPDLVMPFIFLGIRKLFKAGFASPIQTGGAIDIVIPTISKDFDLLSHVLESVRKHVQHPVNDIFIVSTPTDDVIEFCSQNNLTFIDENSVLGYGKDRISYVVNGQDRSGWLFQQLLKLSCENFVRSENYLVIDSDTVLVRNHLFIDDGKFVFQESGEWHTPYVESFNRMFNIIHASKLSFVAHMMIFNVRFLAEMKHEIESKHGTRWDEVFILQASETEASCVSEYDTYANWFKARHPEQFASRPFYNKSLSRTQLSPLSSLKQTHSRRYNSLSFHSYDS